MAKNLYLAEDSAGAERGQDRALVVRYDAESASLDDVHLLPDVALAADVVSWTENLGRNIDELMTFSDVNPHLSPQNPNYRNI